MGIVQNIKEEIRIIRERDPAIHSNMEVFLYPSFKVMLYYRLAHRMYLHRHYFLARWISQKGVRKTGIEIHPGAKIGKCLFIDHGMGIVIGETAEIGDYCNIYHGVTLGGTGKDKGKRHPTLGNHVLVGAGAKILGPFTVGDNARIGGNAVVLKEVPPNATVVGVPGVIVTKGDNQQQYCSWELDQVSLPDPIQQEIDQMQQRLNTLAEDLRKVCQEQGK